MKDADSEDLIELYAIQLAKWKECAIQLATAIKVGNDHGYGLRIGDDALAYYEQLKSEDKVQ